MPPIREVASHDHHTNRPRLRPAPCRRRPRLRVGRRAIRLGDARRYFDGTKRVIERDGLDDISVEIYGTQGTARDVTRHIIVIDDDREALTLTSSDHARQFGRALLAAADEWEQMAGYDRIEVTR